MKAQWKEVPGICTDQPEHHLNLGRFRAACLFWDKETGWTWLIEVRRGSCRIVSRSQGAICATLPEAQAAAKAAARQIAAEILSALDDEEDR